MAAPVLSRWVRSVFGRRRASRFPGEPAALASELPAGRYELRATYDPAKRLGDAEVHSVHAQLHEAAEAFATCAVPFKRLIWVYDDGGADELDELEEKYVAAVCAEHGYDVEEIEG
jgi:hypothetical protein